MYLVAEISADHLASPAIDTKVVSNVIKPTSSTHHDHIETIHTTGETRDLLRPADRIPPLPPMDLWRAQLAFVQDKRSEEHCIYFVIVDTASDYSAITYQKAGDLELKQRPTRQKLSLGDASDFDAVAYMTLTVRLPNIGMEGLQINALLFQELPQNRELLIGLPHIRKYKIAKRIVEIEEGWETSTGPGLTLEPGTGLVCALLSRRSNSKCTNVSASWTLVG